MTLTAAQLFQDWFRPIYPPDLQSDEALAQSRTIDANPAKNPQLLAQLDEIAQVFAQLAPSALGKPELALDFSDASVHRLGAALDRTTRDALLAGGTPGDRDAPLARIVIHGAIYVGACVVKNHGGQWIVRRPMWESSVRLASRAGEGELAPFQWWLKALADHEIDKGGLASRYRQYVERATARPEALPKIVSMKEDRALPTLRTVRYDLLHKYLKAHLPEMRDLGRDFPTAEELQALGFLELEFLLLGEGRMLLIHGRGKAGLHLLWLDHQGFSHAAFFPATPGDPHSIERSGDKLVIRFKANERDIEHEMLWWG